MTKTNHIIASANSQPDQSVIVDWRGVRIAVHHCPHWLGNEIAHLEIVSERPERAPLPITETGYRSHFLPAGEVEKNGGAAAYVLDWLESEAQFDEWQDHMARTKQLSLF